MLFLGIIRNIVVHLLPVEKEKTRHEKVSVHLLHGTRAVVAGLAPAGRRIVESNMFFLLSGQGQGMVLYKRLLRVQIQAVVISRELPVKRKNNSFGQEHREAGRSGILFPLCKFTLPDGKFFQTGDTADVLNGISAFGDRRGDQFGHPVAHGESARKGEIRILGQGGQESISQLIPLADNHPGVILRNSTAEQGLADNPGVQFPGRKRLVRTGFAETSKFLREPGQGRGEPFKQEAVCVSAQEGLPSEGNDRGFISVFPGESQADPAQKPGVHRVTSVGEQPLDCSLIFTALLQVSE